MDFKTFAVSRKELELVKKNVEKLTILLNEVKECIENNGALIKPSSQNNGFTVVENEINLLKEEKKENNKKIETIDNKLAKLNFEHKELKDSMNENWEITGRNRLKQEQADGKIKSLEEENATIKTTVSEHRNSQNNTNDNLKILEEKYTTLTDKSCGLPSPDDRHFKCEMCEKIFANKEQLIQHKKTEHRKSKTCRICEQHFEENFKLEEHLINVHKKSKGYNCMQHNCSLILKWRLKKHEEGHRSGIQVKTCHYFNNNKICPYEIVGCMFKHTEAKKCSKQSRCSNKKCQFRHD